MNSDPYWKWTACIARVSCQSPSLIFSISKSDSEPHINALAEAIEIRLSKPLMHCEEVGWNWHKSWNLPNISICCKSYPSEVPEREEIWASLHLLKKLETPDIPRTSEMAEMRMVDLGLKGKSRIRLNPTKEEKLEFSSLKITTTSFSHQYKQLLPFIEPFLPGVLFRDFFKGKNRSVKFKGEIENSFEGMYNYLSAPNIRFKVKHPLFLLIKFSETLVLYCRKSNENKIKKENLIVEFQNALLSNYSKKVKSEAKTDKNTDFIILAKNLHTKDKKKTQKINGLLHIIDEYLIRIVSKESDVPNGYYPYSKTEELRDVYRTVYPLINSQKINTFSNIFSNSKGNKAEERQADSGLEDCLENPRKKIKLELNSEGSLRTSNPQNDEKTANFKKIDRVSEFPPNFSIICSTNRQFSRPHKPIVHSAPSFNPVPTQKTPIKREEVHENYGLKLENTINTMNFYQNFMGSMMYMPGFFDFMGKAFIGLYMTPP